MSVLLKLFFLFFLFNGFIAATSEVKKKQEHVKGVSSVDRDKNAVVFPTSVTNKKQEPTTQKETGDNNNRSKKAVVSGAIGPFAEKLNRKDIDSIQKQMQTTASLSFLFIQKTYSKLRNKTNIQEGKASLLRGGKNKKFLWQYLKPVEDNWLFDGSDWISWAKGDIFALRYSAGVARGRSLNSIVDMVSDFGNLLQNFRFDSASKSGNKVTVELLKRKSLQKEDSLTVVLLKEADGYFVSELTVFYKSKNHTNFKFSKHTKNSIPTAVFSLPKGIKVKEAL